MPAAVTANVGPTYSESADKTHARPFAAQIAVPMKRPPRNLIIASATISLDTARMPAAVTANVDPTYSNNLDSRNERDNVHLTGDNVKPKDSHNENTLNNRSSSSFFRSHLSRTNTMSTTKDNLHAILDIVYEGGSTTKNHYIPWVDALGIAKLYPLDTLWHDCSLHYDRQSLYLNNIDTYDCSSKYVHSSDSPNPGSFHARNLYRNGAHSTIQYPTNQYYYSAPHLKKNGAHNASTLTPAPLLWEIGAQAACSYLFIRKKFQTKLLPGYKLRDFTRAIMDSADDTVDMIAPPCNNANNHNDHDGWGVSKLHRDLYFALTIAGTI